MAPLPHSAYVYVDAQYVAKELESAKQSPWFDPSEIFRFQFKAIDGVPFQPARVFFYDAMLGAESPQEARDQQRAYLERIESIPFVEVRTGFIRAGKRKQQKGVDVQIAVDALVAASNRLTNAVVLVSGDADFCPLAEAVRRTGTYFFVLAFQNKLPAELERAADAVAFVPPPANWPSLASPTPTAAPRDRPA